MKKTLLMLCVCVFSFVSCAQPETVGQPPVEESASQPQVESTVNTVEQTQVVADQQQEVSVLLNTGKSVQLGGNAESYRPFFLACRFSGEVVQMYPEDGEVWLLGGGGGVEVFTYRYVIDQAVETKQCADEEVYPEEKIAEGSIIRSIVSLNERGEEFLLALRVIKGDEKIMRKYQAIKIVELTEYQPRRSYLELEHIPSNNTSYLEMTPEMLAFYQENYQRRPEYSDTPIA